MSKKRVEIGLLIVIGLEILAAASLIIWAVFIRDGANGTDKKTTTTNTTAQIPALQPILYSQGLSRPTSIASPADTNDKRLFVTESQGTIRVITSDGKAAGEPPFLDIRSKVQSKGEMGLLGIALDPDFKNNGYFYVDYIDKDQNTIVARYKISGQTGIADPGSEKILIKQKQPYANHNGGQLAFGPDGYLYIGFGDGGGTGDPENRAQNKDELFGKILRIDVKNGEPYSIPKTNPFAGQKNARGEIWALGLRNPWRFSFDKKTGDLYIADVGQDKYEEIDFQLASSKGGENYGWRCYEGTHPYNTEGCQPQSSYKSPIIEYDHADNRCSITGGYVYRGTENPAMQGKYFYGDYCSGDIFYADQASGKWQANPAVSTQFSISTFGQDSSGELYVADIQTGSIYRLVDTAQH